jgi:uncharacterized protein YodC (DUF2158 family)
MSDFRPGDSVVLKSGGPAMTVAAVVGDKVICIRIDDKDKAPRPFQPATLVLQEEAIPPAQDDD